MSVLCDVGVYVRSMYMSGRRVCEINVYVNILVTRANGCGVEGQWYVGVGVSGMVIGMWACGMCSQ